MKDLRVNPASPSQALVNKYQKAPPILYRGSCRRQATEGIAWQNFVVGVVILLMVIIDVTTAKRSSKLRSRTKLFLGGSENIDK